MSFDKDAESDCTEEAKAAGHLILERYDDVSKIPKEVLHWKVHFPGCSARRGPPYVGDKIMYWKFIRRSFGHARLELCESCNPVFPEL